MKSYKALKELYGPAIAKGLRDAKRDLQNTKPAEDTNCYWMENPDLPGREDCEHATSSYDVSYGPWICKLCTSNMNNLSTHMHFL